MKNTLYRIEVDGFNKPTNYVIATDPTKAVEKLINKVRSFPGCEYTTVDVKTITVICDDSELGDLLVV